MIVGRVIGWVFIAAALIFLGAEAVASLDTGAYQGLALGELWYRLDKASLNLAQAGIQRHIAPWLWDPAIIALLQLPGWLVAGVPGLALVVLFRRRKRAKRWFAKRRGLS